MTLQSTTLGSTGHISGSSVSTNQFIGWRFQIHSTFSVEHIGGHLLSDPFSSGNIFAALVSLDSITAVPHGSPFADNELIAATTFRPSFPSEQVTVPLAATLQPGSYALVFGTGHLALLVTVQCRISTTSPMFRRPMFLPTSSGMFRDQIRRRNGGQTLLLTCGLSSRRLHPRTSIHIARLVCIGRIPYFNPNQPITSHWWQ